MLLRHAQPYLYEGGVVACTSLPFLVVLPPSLRLLLGAPLALSPLCAGWSDELDARAAAAAEAASMDASNDVMHAATLLYSARPALCDAEDTATTAAAARFIADDTVTAKEND